MTNRTPQELFPPAQEGLSSRERQSQRMSELLAFHKARLQHLESVQKTFKGEQR